MNDKCNFLPFVNFLFFKMNTNNIAPAFTKKCVKTRLTISSQLVKISNFLFLKRLQRAAFNRLRLSNLT
jgi:hypothetical protein